MRDFDKEIETLKQELLDKYEITMDSDLLKQLGIVKDEDKKKLFMWIRYQCLFSSRSGYQHGVEDTRTRYKKLKRDMKKLKKLMKNL